MGHHIRPMQEQHTLNRELLKGEITNLKKGLFKGFLSTTMNLIYSLSTTKQLNINRNLL